MYYGPYQILFVSLGILVAATMGGWVSNEYRARLARDAARMTACVHQKAAADGSLSSTSARKKFCAAMGYSGTGFGPADP